MIVDGVRLLNFSSNNYLGLANRPELRVAAHQASETHGWGAGASRLISGTTDVHEAFEARFAEFKGFGASLLYTTGYAANLGIIQSLVGSGDYVVGDALNHASIIDGARLSGADYRTYAHLDANALDGVLSQVDKSTAKGKRLVVTETVFSMDGDVAPLADIVEICERHNAMLLVDEAHATGCVGPEGKGALALEGLASRVTVSMSTLSKALGSLGGIAASTESIRSYLVNSSRSFIYTTALPAPVVAASEAALGVLQQEPELVTRLAENSTLMRDGLRAQGFNILASSTQIIPIVVGSPGKTLEFALKLREKGLFTVAVRPPTVPPGASRVRLSVMATHEAADLHWALTVFEEAGKELGIL
ncbi:MAG: glycine C-acetyltransferase [Chloroflexi bacterium]|nr:MAG: glycine C-acetyltransferase [Chloroflexota bacterium]